MTGLRNQNRTRTSARSELTVERAPMLLEMPRVFGRNLPPAFESARAGWSAAIRLARSRPREAALVFSRIAGLFDALADSDQPHQESAEEIRRVALANALEVDPRTVDA